MQVFRKKYLYNPENPIFESDTVQTYNCMNTETKDNKLIIIHHISEPPFVDPSPGILQPIEEPTMSDPYSVYPLVYCCSQIGQINQNDAMYVIKCITEIKMKNPLYCVLSPQGICVSDVEGLLPNRSPPIFEIATQLLAEDSDTVVSKEAFQICRGIRDGENVNTLINAYGWANPKKEKPINDDQFWIFKGKRKEEGPLGDEYSLAWFSKFGIARCKFIDLSKDGYEEEFFDDYMKKIEFYRKNEEKIANTIEVFKFVKENRGIKIFTQVLNQGTLSDYLARRKERGKSLTQKTALPMLEAFAKSMKKLSEENIRGHGAMHSKLLYVHSGRIVLGEPLLVTDKMEKKLRDLKSTFDYYAPEIKENIILPENLMKLQVDKMDIWSFGFVLHKVITRDLPTFDPTRKPILHKSHFSPGMHDLIIRCLSLSPSNRPSWDNINLRDLQSSIVVQQFQEQESGPVGTQVIRLDSPSKARSQHSSSMMRRERAIQEEEIINISEKNRLAQEENAKLQEEEEEQVVIPIPVELSLRLKRIKMVAKIIIIMVLYIFVFFREFWGNSIAILLVRSYYGVTALHLVDSSSNTLSTTSIITHQPNYFLLNDISFEDVQNTYNCINDQFDPIYNPDYSLLTYVQSPSFLVLLLTGWAASLLICIVKCISIWKGGLSNRPAKNLPKYLVVYAYHELTLAALLFAHFYIWQFFYFAGATPCFSIQNYDGIEPFFDSTLYLFLENTDGYMQNVFASLGILAILGLISALYYACGPKLDQKHCLSVPSILFRIVPFVLFILICRIGVFMLYGPTAVNDDSEMLPAILEGSAVAVFGLIPQIFIIICVTTEVLLELFFYWCERKAAESDKLAKLFNIRQKKTTNLEESQAALNDMSLAKSHNKEDQAFA